MKTLCMLLGIVLLQPLVPSEEFTKEAKITLQKYTLGDGKEKPVIRVGNKVTFEINAYIDDFFKKPIINTNATIKNTTSVHMRATYVITFYDAKNQVIGVHATGWTVKPHDDVHYGSGLIYGKEEDFRRVTHYKVYTSAYETPPEK
jgi:hypothetical protein